MKKFLNPNAGFLHPESTFVTCQVSLVTKTPTVVPGLAPRRPWGDRESGKADVHGRPFQQKLSLDSKVYHLLIGVAFRSIQ